jgi:prolyl oligopeptidase
MKNRASSARILPIVLASLLATSVAGSAQPGDSAPVAARGDTVEQIHGLTIHDPYRWMEGQNNTAFENWLKAQGAVGREKLDASPALDKWRVRLRVAGASTVTNRLQHRVGNRLFYMHLAAGKQGVLRVRLENGMDKVLFDPNTVTGGAHASITGYSVSPDGKLLAVNVDRGGEEITEISFYNVDTGQALADRLDRIWGEFQAQWLGEAGVFYTQMAPAGQVDKMLNMRARYHRLGSPSSRDVTLVAAGDGRSVPMLPQEFPIIATDPSSEWALLIIGGARPETRVCAIKVHDVLHPAARYHCLVDYADQVTGVTVLGNELYLQSVRNAPNGQLLTLNLSGPTVNLASAHLILAQDPEWVLSGITAARDGLYIKRTRQGVDGLLRLAEGGKPRSLNLPFEGQAALIDSDTLRDGMIFTYQGWTRPRTLFDYDPRTNALTDLKLGAFSPRNYSALVETETGQARSLDGTLVPITILKPAHYKPDGATLAIVLAYGAYGVMLDQPSFDPMMLEWVAAGNLYVMAGIRGGGEKGDAWRLAGKGIQKHHSIEDFVAAADALTAKGYSNPKRIALYSASAGGIIVGGAIDRFPTHFGAAISHAGMLNPTRLGVDTNGANQYAEFGDPNTPQGFKSLYEMDAYLHIQPHVAYPAVLLDVGLNDNRVAPWNSGKYGAALRAANSGPNLILFRTDSDSGHFGTSLSQEAAEKADHYTFVEMTLGGS